MLNYLDKTLSPSKGFSTGPHTLRFQAEPRTRTQNLEEANTTQSWLGRLFGYGTFQIQGNRHRRHRAQMGGCSAGVQKSNRTRPRNIAGMPLPPPTW